MSRVVIALVVVAVALLSAFVVFLFAPYHPITETQMQEAIQMLKDQVEKASTRSMELERLKYSSQIQLLSSRLTNATADIQALKDDFLQTSVEIGTTQQEQSCLDISFYVLGVEANLLNVQNEHLQLLLEGWEIYKNHLYYFSFDKKSWHEAEKFCMSKGAHLASVTSDDEQDYVARFTSISHSWIGLTKYGKKSSWRWVDGTPFNAAQIIKFWDGKPPDNWAHKNGRTEDCINVYPIWSDRHCDIILHWVCKKPINEKVA